MTNTDAKMQLAIAAVAADGLSVREAARRYGVPRTTLQRKLSKDPNIAHTTGHTNASGSRSNSVTSPSGGVSSDTTASPSGSTASPSGEKVAAPPTTATAAAAAAAATRAALASAVANAFDANLGSLSAILGLYETNGNGTMPAAAAAATAAIPVANVTGRKRSADVMSALEKQPLPISKGALCYHTGLIRHVVADATTIRAALVIVTRTGPHKAINCKVRMLCTSAGSALDELSNEMIMEGKCIYKLGLGQSPFPIPQCIVDELRCGIRSFRVGLESHVAVSWQRLPRTESGLTLDHDCSPSLFLS